jgi:CheY-like chemotaxis protein
MRVAWVDDEASVRQITCRMVERSGGTAIGFEDHASLLASDEGPFGAAVLQPSDATPADAVRLELRRRGVGIVLLASADSAEGCRGQSIDVDAFDGFLAKPFTLGEVREALGLDDPRGRAAS